MFTGKTVHNYNITKTETVHNYNITKTEITQHKILQVKIMQNEFEQVVVLLQQYIYDQRNV